MDNLCNNVDRLELNYSSLSLSIQCIYTIKYNYIQILYEACMV